MQIYVSRKRESPITKVITTSHLQCCILGSHYYFQYARIVPVDVAFTCTTYPCMHVRVPSFVNDFCTRQPFQKIRYLIKSVLFTEQFPLCSFYRILSTLYTSYTRLVILYGNRMYLFYYHLPNALL